MSTNSLAQIPPSIHPTVFWKIMTYVYLLLFRVKQHKQGNEEIHQLKTKQK